jgi:hypothetical protein
VITGDEGLREEINDLKNKNMKRTLFCKADSLSTRASTPALLRRSVFLPMGSGSTFFFSRLCVKKLKKPRFLAQKVLSKMQKKLNRKNLRKSDRICDCHCEQNCEIRKIDGVGSFSLVGTLALLFTFYCSSVLAVHCCVSCFTLLLLSSTQHDTSTCRR